MLSQNSQKPSVSGIGSSAGLHQIINQFLQENTDVFDEFVQSLKRDVDNVPQSRDRELPKARQEQLNGKDTTK